jgi:hypothetical protein
MSGYIFDPFMDMLLRAEWLQTALVSTMYAGVQTPVERALYAYASKIGALYPVRIRRRSEMEKHEQSYTSAKEPRAKVQTTLKADRVDPAKALNRASPDRLDARPGVTADVRKGGF